MNYYPAFLDLRTRPCLVIGGGEVAERKVLSLIAADAAVTVVSPTLTPELQRLAQSGMIAHSNKRFSETDLAGAFLVIAATNAPEVNARAAASCKQRGILVNVASPPEESSFIVPSLVARGGLQIAVSTGGAGPALAKRVRQELEQQYGPEYALFLDAFARVRERVLADVPDQQARTRIFQSIVDSEAIALFRQGRKEAAEEKMYAIAGIAKA